LKEVLAVAVVAVALPDAVAVAVALPVVAVLGRFGDPLPNDDTDDDDDDDNDDDDDARSPVVMSGSATRVLTASNGIAVWVVGCSPCVMGVAVRCCRLARSLDGKSVGCFTRVSRVLSGLFVGFVQNE
jgi:hypothetical protein